MRIKTACFSIKVAKAVCLDSKRHAVTGRADAYTVEKPAYCEGKKLKSACCLYEAGKSTLLASADCMTLIL